MLIHDVATGRAADADGSPVLNVRVDSERQTGSSDPQPVDPPRAPFPTVAVSTFSDFGFGDSGLLGGVTMQLAAAGDVDLPRHSTCIGALVDAVESSTTPLPPIPAVGLLMPDRPRR